MIYNKQGLYLFDLANIKQRIPKWRRVRFGEGIDLAFIWLEFHVLVSGDLDNEDILHAVWLKVLDRSPIC